MAGLLDALASYVTSMLTEMARDEVAMVIGVSSEIDDLAVKLGDLKNFLADADKRNITDESVRRWVEELKRAMYQATDILDLCQLKFSEQGSSEDIGCLTPVQSFMQSKYMGCLNPLLFCMRNPLHAHDIGTRIKGLNEKLNDICKRAERFNFLKLEAYPDRRMARPHGIDRKTHPLLERSEVVGDKIEDDTRALVDMLIENVADTSDSIMVFAIVGVGGIGKTTLCKKVFNDEAMQSKFAKMIWLSITQEFSELDLLRTAITAAGGNMPGPGGGSEDKALLVPALANSIKDKKFFLVLDDMWGSAAWSNLLKAPFSHGAAGSCILITTRHDAVARGMKAMEPYHHVEKLGSEDAWSLLKKQVLTTEKDEYGIEMLKDVGLKIIEMCDGLPLAVKVMGGLLCQREKERHAWQRVLNNAIWSVSQIPEELNYAICLSYEDLPSCLRPCFLHYSLIPGNTILASHEIVSMWISEGFVHGNLDDLEELGHEYYRQLILRNLIEPIPDTLGQYFCNMHDVIRSFAQFVARDDALIAHKGEIINSRVSLQGLLRLSIERDGMGSNEFEWRSLQEQKSLRSLMLIGNLKIQSGDSLASFSGLRMLHIESTNIAALVESLYQLKHLRYLALHKCTDLNRLPENIHKLKFLQHLSLEDCENLVKLPDSIVKLQELRYLAVEDTCVNGIPRGFGALTNLRELDGFLARMDGGWCSLEELGPLSKLRSLGLGNLQNVSDASLVLHCSSLLGDDGLVRDVVSEEDQGVIQEVFDELCPPSCIEDIRIDGYFGRQLPRWIMLTTMTPLNSLRIVKMDNLACCTELPDGLCQIPCLEFLGICRVPVIKRVGPEFVQSRDPCHHPAFQRLHKLILHGLLEWEEWEWKEEVQAMPVLERLEIKGCKLRCIPPGLATHARALKKLIIWHVQSVQSVANLASVVELELYSLPDLANISNLPKLQKLEIGWCGKLESLQEMSALRRFILTVDYGGKQLPLYLQTMKPGRLLLNCCPEVVASMALGKSGSEWDKFSHIQHVEAYADYKGIEKKWHIFFTSEPYSMETNIDPQEMNTSPV
ncbi:hypothetical protein ACQJBY_029576 [Aegilops geniculata]